MSPFIGGALIGAGTQLLGGATSLFGPSQKTVLRWQKEAQMELNQQAAELNYMYGEKSAENAYNRQMAMYERSYQDQSYQAMRSQMEDAGLSVGLMYGNGASGGGSGSMQGAPQGATGGAVAGDAGAAIGMALQAKAIQADVALKNAEAIKTIVEANKAEQERVNVVSNTKTTDAIRNYLVENEKQKAFGQWMENIKREIQLTDPLPTEGQVTVGKAANKTLDKVLEYDENTAFFKTMMSDVRRAVAAAGYDEQNVEYIKASTALKNKETSLMLRKVIALEAAGRAAEAQAAAREMELKLKEKLTDYQTGDYVTWKTWYDIGKDVVNAAATAAVSAK